MTSSNNSFSKTLLVVDDEPAVLRTIKEGLEISGYQVITETTGRGAIETVRKSELLAVLLDLSLSDLNGLEVLQQIKSIKQSLPIIVVTGNREESEARQAMELGALDYITKPVDFRYLTKIIRLQLPE